jgi:hypothetical protein
MTMTEADSLVVQLLNPIGSRSTAWLNLLNYLNLANLEVPVFAENSYKSLVKTIKNNLDETQLGNVQNLLRVMDLCLKHQGLVDFFSEDDIVIMLNSLLSAMGSDDLETKKLALSCFSNSRISCNIEKVGVKILSAITNSIDTEGIELLSLTALNVLFKYSQGLIKETSKWYKHVFPLLFHSSKEVQQHADLLLNVIKVNLEGNDIFQTIEVYYIVKLGQFKY